MFDFLEGTIEAKEAGHLVLRTGGVGWSVAVPLKASQAGDLGDELKLFLHLAVGDHSFSLYGFPSAPERALFRKLLGVGGIGPMSALSLLSALGPDGLSRAIIEEDTDLICSIKGVGKKTAERLLVDLRDSLPLPSGGKTGGPATAEDLLKVLDGLGFSPSQARAATRSAHNQLGDDAPFEDLLRTALHENAP